MRSRLQVLLMAAAALVVATALGNLDATIRQMHLPLGVSGGVGDIASPLEKRDDALEIVRSWKASDDVAAIRCTRWHWLCCPSSVADTDNASARCSASWPVPNHTPWRPSLRRHP